MNNNENNLLQLIENNNDTYQDLRLKNKKLRDIIIKITEQLKTINLKYQNLEKQFTSEKQTLLDKLEQITGNYKLYAEGYQEKALLKKDMGTLINNYKQNNRVMNSFKDSFVFLLKKSMNMFSDFNKLERMQSNNNKFIELLNNMKNNLYNNILRFKKNIDMINFPEFYKEYLSFIELEQKEENENNNFYGKRIYRNTMKQINNNKNNSINNLDRNNSSKNFRYKNRRKSSGKNENKYSFTRIDINKINDNDTKYKNTNYFTNYQKQIKDKDNKKDEIHKVNYLKYGKV
jgi:hypothetical protein